jgi:hypothetical protein
MKLSDESTWRTAPRNEEAEVSVFGPGKGESVVCHLGFGRWMVVDSCVDRDTGRAVSLDYLEAIGIDVASNVDVVTATHWHDDHIAGLADVVSAAANSTFHFSMALQSHSFLTLVKAVGERSLMGKPGAIEFDKIIKVLEDRVRSQGRQWAPQPAVAHTVIWRPEPDAQIQNAGWRVEALSPSTRSVVIGLEEIAQMLPQAYNVKRRITPVSPNHTSMVTLLVVGSAVILLGGDLQETGAAVQGWSEILESPRRPPERASAIKLAHHGADNADHPRIWSELLVDDPVATLTPYDRGMRPRPSPDDIGRICGNTASAYISTKRPSAARRKRDGHTEKLLRARAHPIRSASGQMGQIRLRRPVNGDGLAWTIETFGAASPLCPT